MTRSANPGRKLGPWCGVVFAVAALVLGAFGAAAAQVSPPAEPGIHPVRPGPALADTLASRLLPDSLRAILEEENAPADSTPASIPGEKTESAAPSPAPPPAPPEERETKAETGLTLFGRDLFARAPTTFVPPTNVPVGPHYVVGPDDELVVNVWGQTELNYTVTVSREGDIVLPEVGLIHVAGLTMEDVEKLLLRQLGRFYSGIQVNVSAGRLRTVTVFVIGDVERPGAYTVSSLATVFNALYSAGGPSESGSLRRVRLVRRGGEGTAIDFYRYLLQGDNSGDARVEEGSTIFVPPLGPTVTVRGAVLRPAIYELLGGETLEDLLEMAGGTEPNAYLGRISIQRIADGEKKRLIDVREEGEADAGFGILLRSGDVVTVAEVIDELVNRVEILGQVQRPGEYEFKQGMRVLDLVNAAEGVRGEAYLDRAEIKRTNPDHKQEIISFQLGLMLRGDPAENPLLQPRDRVHVYSSSESAPVDSVTIRGLVKRPGTYPLVPGMTMADLLFQAGGFLPSAYLPGADVARFRPHAGMPGGGETDMLFVSLADHGAGSRKTPFLLQRGDRVYVREIPDWREPGEVELLGEVRFPGRYPLVSEEETLSQLIERAGGLTAKSFLPGVVFQRPDDGRLIVDVERLMRKGDRREDILLHDGDRITIPLVPETVQVRGAIYLPGSIKYAPGKKTGYYIEKCGGYVEDADLAGVRIVQPDGTVQRPRTWWPDPKVNAGAVVEVPHKAPSETDWGQVVSLTAQTLASVSTFIFFTLEILRR